MTSVSVGWKVLDKDSIKYKYIRAEKGGGVHFNSNSTASDSLLNHVLGVLACSRAWRAYMLTWLACLRARVLGMLTCLRAHVLGVLACSRAWRAWCACVCKCVLVCLICLAFQYLNLKIRAAKNCVLC